MFEPSSRYYSLSLEQATMTMADGRVVAYTRRRFLPRGSSMALLDEVRVTQDDRLDLVAYRALGDPEQYWRVCDANDAMNPDDLTELVDEMARWLRVAVPQP